MIPVAGAYGVKSATQKPIIYFHDLTRSTILAISPSDQPTVQYIPFYPLAVPHQSSGFTGLTEDVCISFGTMELRGGITS